MTRRPSGAARNHHAETRHPMDAGTLLAVAKLGAFAVIVRAWWLARKSAEAARAERAAREADVATAGAAEPALREAA